MPDDEERPPEVAAAGAADQPTAAGWADVVVPDDISSLEADVRAYHRELRERRRQARWDRWFGARAWRRYGLPGSLVAVVLLIAAGVGSSLTVLGHGNRQRSPQTPVAVHPVADVGQVGGLLPDTTVWDGTAHRPLRDVRPAIVALLPPRCGCGDVLDAVAGQANEFGLELYVVGTPGTRGQAERLVSTIRRGRAGTLYDATSTLEHTYPVEGVTLLLVAPDATVSAVTSMVTGSTRLEPALTTMLSPTVRAQSTSSASRR